MMGGQQSGMHQPEAVVVDERPGDIGERVEAKRLELRVADLAGEPGARVGGELAEALLEEPAERQAFLRGSRFRGR